MDTFAFIIHPIDPKRDIARKFPLLARVVNDWIIYQLAPFFPPIYLSEVEGITSRSSGKQIKGWLIACPLTPRHFLQLPETQVYRKIIETGRLAEKLGAKILGLGAYTSVVGDAGLTIARSLDIPVTTGDSYTVAVAVETIKSAARAVDISPEYCIAAVVGATGTIGKACAALLSKDMAELILISRHTETLVSLREKLEAEGSKAQLQISTDLLAAWEAQMVIMATSAMHPVITSEHLQPGCVVCDMARPHSISPSTATSRPDVLVIDGGVVDVPGEVDFHFDFGLPSGKAYACMAETIALTLEGCLEDYTLGKDLNLNLINKITEITERHGFQISAFRSFEHAVTDEQIQRVKENTRRRHKHS